MQVGTPAFARCCAAGVPPCEWRGPLPLGVAGIKSAAAVRAQGA